ncbi:MAG TPA: SRPBCC domain-containing protein [Verrucomicrobiae bacterium]
MSTKNISTEAVVLERTFSAPVAIVWRAITDVGEMRRWHFDLKEFKPQKGFEFAFIVEHEGNTYDHRCKVVEVIPQKKISYTWRYHGHEGNSLVTFELFDEGGKTKLKLTHEGLETFPKLPAFARKNFEQGWTQLVGTSLKDFVEKKSKAK